MLKHNIFKFLIIVAMTSTRTGVVGRSEEAVIHAGGSVHVQPSSMERTLSYGVDVSWPMQQERIVLENNPLGAVARETIYDEYIRGCVGPEKSPIHNKECNRWERDRISMNKNQPAISQNYTHAGYAKVDTPVAVRKALQAVWNQHQDAKEKELWERHNTYLNHWATPSHMIDIGSVLSGSQETNLVKEVQSVLEAWTQQPLVLTSLYGIRIYGTGAILAPHVDRLPLVSSAIINVAQDVENPWILEVVGHDGKATNITMEPWDMVLYESHSVIHGRPYPLNGKYFANVFVHFEPVGHSKRHVERNKAESPEAAYERALKSEQQRDGEGGNNQHNSAPTPTIPSYVPKDKEGRWKQQFAYEKVAKISPKPTQASFGDYNPHFAAADGLLDRLKEIAENDRSQLFKKDHNGWRPLHEAARAGEAEVIKYLLEEGAQVNERPNDGEGGTPLWWAERKGKRDAIEVLKSYGAVSLSPMPKDQKGKPQKDKENTK